MSACADDGAVERQRMAATTAYIKCRPLLQRRRDAFPTLSTYARDVSARGGDRASQGART